MTAVSLKTKQAYFAKVKRDNYVASMKLEGIDTASVSSSKSDKTTILEQYRRR